MARARSSLPDDLETLLEGSVEAGRFDSVSDAVRHAVREYFEENGDARLEAALRQYVEGEIELDTAAELVGVSPVELLEIMREHEGVVDAGIDD